MCGNSSTYKIQLVPHFLLFCSAGLILLKPGSESQFHVIQFVISTFPATQAKEDDDDNCNSLLDSSLHAKEPISHHHPFSLFSSKACKLSGLSLTSFLMVSSPRKAKFWVFDVKGCCFFGKPKYPTPFLFSVNKHYWEAYSPVCCLHG
ncbi:hypothetical protein OIU76_019316 [Salix suchowensis]|nr:hypothetical protein OIU76_019316 [Salix suchowensis]